MREDVGEVVQGLANRIKDVRREEEYIYQREKWRTI